MAEYERSQDDIMDHRKKGFAVVNVMLPKKFVESIEVERNVQ